MATRTINFTVEFEDELTHLDKQYNKSRYVCELIRQDRYKKEEESELIKTVKEALTHVSSPNTQPNKINNSINSQNIKRIDNSNIKMSAASLLNPQGHK